MNDGRLLRSTSPERPGPGPLPAAALRALQIELMTLKPGEEIGKETHRAVDQFFRVEQGTGEVELAGVRTPIGPGFAVVVPAGLRHNIVNTGKEPLRLYTIYSPPNQRDGVVHHERSEAEHDSEHFEGDTTE